MSIFASLTPTGKDFDTVLQLINQTGGNKK
jgi:hypothetical protein